MWSSCYMYQYIQRVSTINAYMLPVSHSHKSLFLDFPIWMKETSQSRVKELGSSNIFLLIWVWASYFSSITLLGLDVTIFSKKMSRCAAISKYMVFDLPTGRELSMTIYIIFYVCKGGLFSACWYGTRASTHLEIISDMLSFIYTLYLNLARRD